MGSVITAQATHCQRAEGVSHLEASACPESQCKRIAVGQLFCMWTLTSMEYSSAGILRPAMQTVRENEKGKPIKHQQSFFISRNITGGTDSQESSLECFPAFLLAEHPSEESTGSSAAEKSHTLLCACILFRAGRS